MTTHTRITLFLLGELVFSVRSIDPATFKRWLYGGLQDLGEPVVEELLSEWIHPLLTEEESDRLVAWNLGVSL